MEAARGGKRVVRAVSGDPGLDAYAAEEMLACAAAGIPFEVVPGVAAAVGVPAYAGVPLRDAQGADVRFVDARTASDRCWTEVGASRRRPSSSPTTLDTVAAAAGELVAAGPQARHPADRDRRRHHHPAADLDGDAGHHRADAQAGARCCRRRRAAGR